MSHTILPSMRVFDFQPTCLQASCCFKHDLDPVDFKMIANLDTKARMLSQLSLVKLRPPSGLHGVYSSGVDGDVKLFFVEQLS